MRSINIIIFTTLTFAASSFSIAGEHRQHNVHEHGGGSMNVAVEKNKLLVDLSMPAMNITGFEHFPTNQDEHEIIERAAMLLKEGQRLFAPSPAANCTLVHVKVDSALLEDSNHHDGLAQNTESNRTHEEHHSEEDQEHHHEEMESDAENHADFDITYEFNCAQPAQLSELSLTLFSVFPGVLHLRTQAITPKDQLSVELNAKSNTLKLK